MKRVFQSIYPPLFPVILSLITGILLGNGWPDFPLGLFALGAFVALFVFSFFFLKLKPLFFSVGVVAMAWGFFAMAHKVTPEFLPGHISSFADGSPYTITGKTISFSQDYARKKRVVLECLVLKKKGHEPSKVHGRVMVNIYESHGISFAYGDILEFQSPLNPIRNFSNPRGFDYERQMKFQGIFGSAYARGDRIRVIHPDPLSFSMNFIRTLEQLRNNFWGFTRDSLDNPDAAAILVALVTGKKEGIPPKLRELFSRAGASHILAISGLHLSIVALAFFSLFYTLLAWFPLALITGTARKTAGMITLIPLVIYAGFSGFSPSTQRAFIMTAIFMVSFMMERETHPLNTLAIAGTVILIIDPTALFAISFQLSFFALLFILVGFSLVGRPVWMPKNRLAATIITASLVTFFAGLGTFPLIAHYFNLISYVQILANLVLVPLMGFVCLPLGFFALLALPVVPSLAALLVNLAQGILGVCLGYIEVLTRLPFSWSRIITLTLLEVTLIYLFLGGSFLWFSGRKKRGLGLMALILSAGLVCAALGGHARFFPGKLAITLLDVGQGNAALIQTPQGKNILVDGGGFSDNSQFDVGRLVVAPFVWSKRILDLDAVILTHPESDHMNGLVYIFENFTVKLLVKNEDTHSTQAYDDLMALCEQKKIEVWHPGQAESLLEFDGIKLRFYGPGPDPANYNLNNNSLVFQVRFKDFSMLFPGDILKQRELALVRQQGSGLTSMILLSPHHGSISSSHKLFLDIIAPESVVVSCGYGNRYGFPHPEVLKRYQERGSRIFRTDLDGAITLFSDGIGYEILTHKGG